MTEELVVPPIISLRSLSHKSRFKPLFLFDKNAHIIVGPYFAISEQMRLRFTLINNKEQP